MNRWHAALLRFARSHDWIDDAAVDALTYCHGVRNEAYHSGDVEAESCELSILLLASCLREYLPRHHSGKAFTLLTSTTISLGDMEQEATGGAYVSMMGGVPKPPMGSLSTEYWTQCVNELLPPSVPERMAALLNSRLKAIFSSAKRRIEFITTDGRDVGLYDVVESRFFNAGMMAPPERTAPRLSVLGALNYYLALLPREEELLDVADPTERARRLHDLLHAHKPLTRELSTEHLHRQQQRVADALSRGPRRRTTHLPCSASRATADLGSAGRVLTRSR